MHSQARLLWQQVAPPDFLQIFAVRRVNGVKLRQYFQGVHKRPLHFDLLAGERLLQIKLAKPKFMPDIRRLLKN